MKESTLLNGINHQELVNQKNFTRSFGMESLKGLVNEQCPSCHHEHERINYKNGNFVYGPCKVITFTSAKDSNGEYRKPVRQVCGCSLADRVVGAEAVVAKV